jgi:mRNA export factor
VVLFPVNSVSFSPVSNIWFMTCGSDGNLNFWDFNVRNKIKSLSFAGTPVCHAKVSPLGDYIAYGLGNDWHLGAEGNKWQPKLGVHRMT